MKRIACLVPILILGCGDGKDGDSAAPPTATTTDPPPTYEASWSGVEQFFAENCDTCHPATTDLDLHAAIADDVQSGAGAYVVAGDSANSLLWVVIGTPTLSFMPPSGQLADESVAHVQAWIDNGAPIP
jgi:cytochrome c5